jgi:hypothetical protein
MDGVPVCALVRPNGSGLNCGARAGNLPGGFAANGSPIARPREVRSVVKWSGITRSITPITVRPAPM